jgi:uncharacterized RDD family membrane protein YckC
MERDDLAKVYSPPGSDVNAGLFATPRDGVLADRGVRLLAVTLDGLLACIPFVPMLAAGIYSVAALQWRSPQVGTDVGAPRIPGIGEMETALLLGGTMAIGLLAFLGLAIYQWVLISTTGQSLGKKWTGIRIERMDGGRVDFASGVFLRNWVPKLLSVVPYVGMLFHLLDVLWIFRQDRRCIHDHMASTRVVRLQR